MRELPDSELLGAVLRGWNLDPNSAESYENSLYLKWLSATHGKTRMEKRRGLADDEGREACVPSDVIGVFLEPADVLNAVALSDGRGAGDATYSGNQHGPNAG